MASLVRRQRFQDIRTRVVCLFTGRDLGDTTESAEQRATRRIAVQDAAALVIGGLVFYLNILRNVTDRPEEILRLRIIPGRIEFGRSFLSLEDLEPSLDGNVSGPTNINDLSSLRTLRGLGTGASVSSSSVKAHVEETWYGLSMNYVLTTDTGICSLGPTAMTDHVHRGSGHVHCNRKFKRCVPLTPDHLSLSLLIGTGRISNLQNEAIGENIVLRQVEDNPMARYVALAGELSLPSADFDSRSINSQLEEEEQARGLEHQTAHPTRADVLKPRQISALGILQCDNCISCCLRAALNLQKNERRCVHIVLS